MEGNPNQKIDELIAKAKERGLTNNEEGATNQRRIVLEALEGKMPSDEIIKEIKDLKLENLPDGTRNLRGAIKGHEIVLNQKLEYENNTGGGSAYKLSGEKYKGTIDGNEVSTEDAQKLFKKYVGLWSGFRGMDAYAKRAQEEVESENKTKEAVEDLMNL